MKRIKELSGHSIAKAPLSFKRFLFYRIDSENRFSGIVGSRGVGKSTLMLQIAAEKLGERSNLLYIRMDDPCLTRISLYGIAVDFVRTGGEYLLLDELHQYPDAYQDMLQIFNDIPDLKVLFTCSSAGNEEGLIYDLSRFSSLYYLPGMSYREFLSFRYGMEFPVIGFDELLEYNRLPGAPVLNRIKPLQYFSEYLSIGFYPWSEKSEEEYHQKVRDEIQNSLTEDIMAIWRMDFESLKKIKAILSMLAEKGPLKPNVEEIARIAGTTRDSLLKFLKYLHKAGIIGWLTKGLEDINYFNKPDRLCLNNSNLFVALAMHEPDPSVLFEAFILNQLSLDHQVNLIQDSSYRIDLKYAFKWAYADSKSSFTDQYSYVLDPAIEARSGNRIPIWMLGFLY